MMLKAATGILLTVLLTGMLTSALSIEGGHELATDSMPTSELYVWIIETVDGVDDKGLYNSIALDSNDKPHISYYDDTSYMLKYAHKTGTTWGKETVDYYPDDRKVGYFTSIALDSNDKPHISYHDLQRNMLKYAHKDGGWPLEDAGTGSPFSESTSLALDSGNKPHISYGYVYADTEELRYAHKDGSWGIETVEHVGGAVSQTYSSLALDSNDKPHISYYHESDGDLKYAHKDGGWNIEVADSSSYDTGWFTSIALDSNDKPHISYYDRNNTDLKYAHKDGGWNSEVVDDSGNVGRYTSIALDSNDRPHISYAGGPAPNFAGLKYAYNNGAAWIIEQVDEGTVYHTSIALDSGGQPHISYYWEGDLRYAYRTRDVAVTNVTSVKSVICQGNLGNITATVENQGGFPEVFNVTAYANTTVIGETSVSLSNGSSADIVFTWNATGFSKGNYTISVVADIVAGEIHVIDNTYTDGWVIISMIGDVTGPDGWPDGKCDMRDVGPVARHFGQNSPPAPPNYDVSYDGKIDMKDVGLVARHFGETDP